jgi:predicted nucleic acid-binding protein
MHTLVEVRRNLARVLDGRARQGARARFEGMWAHVDVVELSASVCEAAAGLAEQTGVRALDALHLGAAEAAGGSSLRFVTFDHRLAAAARSLGWDAVGA